MPHTQTPLYIRRGLIGFCYLLQRSCVNLITKIKANT